jgi:hypothetical protein
MNVSRSNPIPTTRSGLLLLLLSCAFSFALSAAGCDRGTTMKVAFVLTDGANVIDMAGPWEVFQDTMVGDRMGFELFTVGESSSPVTMTGGLRVVPQHTFANAPHADIVVAGAQRGASALPEWLRARAKDSRVVMSVCTGAFKLADAGLLEGKKGNNASRILGRLHEEVSKHSVGAWQPVRAKRRCSLYCRRIDVRDRPCIAHC